MIPAHLNFKVSFHWTERINRHEIVLEIRLACLLDIQGGFFWHIPSTAENIEDSDRDCYSERCDYYTVDATWSDATRMLFGL